MMQSHAAEKWLKRSGIFWFAVAAIGQIAFVYFILAFYGVRTATGDLAGWNDKELITGHVPGDHAGNVMFAAHVLVAAVITAGGLAQLTPQIRDRFRAFHRWNGRFYMLAAYLMATGGMWMGWVRGSRLSDIGGVVVSANGVLILIFASAAWAFAASGNIDVHRRWAMRTFMAVSGVWFFRVCLMAWIIINQGPVGMNATMSGPADLAIAFGSYLLPLAVLEIYFAAQRLEAGAVKIAAALLVAGMTALMAVGIFGAIALMWGPYL